MSDAFDKDSSCEGCYYYERSYTVAPCNECSVAYSGMVTNWYVKEELGEHVSDNVRRPKHYKLCNVEAVDVIKATLTKEQFNGFILGNILKYRMRAGKKGNTMEDIHKANQYEEMWDRYND